MAARIEAKAGLWLAGIAAGVGAMVAFPREARPISCVSGPLYVFFDPDDHSISPEAAGILDNSVAVRGHCGLGTRMRIVGYTDRSGAARHNMSLSRWRAEAVRRYLLGRQVAAEDVAVEAAGESRPLLATADGVREAQNRRAEIHYFH